MTPAVPGWLATTWNDLADLVLPADCAGCDAAGQPLSYGVCGTCAAALGTLTPAPARPTPAPPGLPPTTCLGGYDGVLRALLLAYKEKGRYGLAAPLGRLLAEVVAAVADGTRPVVLVPVPSTARAARARHGDHLARLARHAAARLRAAGRPATVANPLRAIPRPDSSALSGPARAATAAGAFQLRADKIPAVRAAAATATVVLVDDVLTTGATLAANHRELTRGGVPVGAAAVLAATRRTRPKTPFSDGGSTACDAWVGWGENTGKVLRTRDD